MEGFHRLSPTEPISTSGALVERWGRVSAWLYGLYAAGLGSILLLLGGLLLLLCCRTPHSAWQWAHRYLRFVLRITGLMPVRSGEALPGGSAILVSNHSSYLDGLLLIAALDHPVVITPKSEVFSWPLAGRLARRLGFLPVDRRTSDSRYRSLVSIERALRAGELVHLFPEGTFTVEAAILPFHGGAFQLAAATQVPVVPVAILGARKALEMGWHLPRRRRLEVKVLKPLEPPKEDESRAIAGLRETVRQRLGRAVGETLCANSDEAPCNSIPAKPDTTCSIQPIADTRWAP